MYHFKGKLMFNSNMTLFCRNCLSPIQKKKENSKTLITGIKVNPNKYGSTNAERDESASRLDQN
jgi:hypothetical protein